MEKFVYIFLLQKWPIKVYWRTPNFPEKDIKRNTKKKIARVSDKNPVVDNISECKPAKDK
jgi:hypothetical protein